MSSASPFAVNVIPPSPEAAALAKYADVPVDLYTGTPWITVPLHDLRERDLQIPVHVSYHASGHKVEDEASRVGLGWTLHAGGLVTRSIRGLPDEYRPGGFLDQASVAGSAASYQSGTPEQRFQAFDAMARGCLNAEPDVYYFTFAGRSGRFQFDWDGTIAAATPEKLHITPIWPDPGADGFIRGWEIVTPDGVHWVFEARETTSSRFDGQGILQNPCLAVLNTKRPPYTWHLTSVSSPHTGSSVAFTYLDYAQATERWSVETQVHNENLGPAVPHRERLVSDIQGKYLSRIETGSGDTTMEFLPGAERTDVTGGPGLRTLGEVRLSDRLGRIVRRWEFGYHYDVGRLGLRSIRELGEGDGQSHPPFLFDYHAGQLAGRLSFQQDHWGFPNGNPAQTLIPATVARRQSGMVALPGADRSAAPAKLTVGMLRKITYPTGGTDTFTFEPHDYSFAQSQVLQSPITEPRFVGCRAPLEDTPPGQEHVESEPFTVAAVGTELVLRISFTHGMRFGGPAYLPLVSIQKSTGEEVFRLYRGGAADPNGDPVYTVDTVVFNPNPDGNAAGTATVPPQELRPGSYVLTARCRRPVSNNLGMNSVAAEMRWEAPTGRVRTLIRHGSGVRIARITRSFGLGGPDAVTSYEYRMDRAGERVSSGSLLESDYIYAQWTQCVVETTGFVNIIKPQFFRYSQNRSALGTTQGSHVGYGLVTVVHGADGERGQTAHHFTSPIEVPDQRPVTVPFPPATSFDFRRGLLIEKADYPAGSVEPVRRVVNAYDCPVRSIEALKVGWEVPAVGTAEGAGGGISGAGYLDRYAIAPYVVNLGYARLVSQETHQFDGPDPSVTRLAYEYQEAGHRQLTRERRATNGPDLIREFRYASDHPAGTDPALDDLVANHVANALTETVTYRADRLVIAAQRNIYARFEGRARPARIETAAIAAPFLAGPDIFIAVTGYYDARHEFRAYDVHGNLVEQASSGGMVTSYLWDAAGTHLVAKIDNATWDQVFHDSSGPRALAGPYSLDPAALPQTAGDYVLSYQRKVGSEPWIRVEKQILGYVPGTPVSTEPIDGLLDDVRLHPIGAHMTTFAHQPLRGLQALSDPNGICTFFEFDGFGRLSVVRDHDRRIRTHYTYHLPEGDEPGYVRTHTVQQGDLRTVEDVINADRQAVARSTDYMDGFGRTVQRVRWRDTPGGRDVVEHLEYDPFGRTGTRYLPCSADDGSGEFRMFGRDTVLTYYASGDDTVAKTNYPFARTHFDDSPLDRIVEQGAPGEAWQPQDDPAKSHTLRYEYRANSASDEVMRWYLDTDGGTSTDGTYPPGELRVKVMRDEHGTRHVVFHDRREREVLRETRATDGAAMRTYFVHDEKDNLVRVLPPRAVPPLDAAALANECYRYRFDHRNRLVERATPGTEPTSLVYDPWDRLVLSQTGNQRVHGRWTYRKFDALDRLVLLGEVEIPSDRVEVAALLDDFYATGVLSECRFELLGTDQRYSDRSFPILNGMGTIDHVLFYDDYRFVAALPVTVTADGLAAVRGHLTGERLRVLGSDRYVSKVTYYDQEYRTIEVLSENHLGSWTRYQQTYTLTGQPLSSLRDHHHDAETTRIQQEYTYDHARRLIRVDHHVNDQQPIMLLSQTYNDLGEMIRKGLHSSDGETFAQLLDYRYTIRGWLSSINRIPDPDGRRRLFTLEQGYETEVAGLDNIPQFNGNVSFATWTHEHPPEEQTYVYHYDAFDRLTAARYRAAGRRDGAFDLTDATYDDAGNILSLSRHGLVGGNRVEIDRLTYRYQANQLLHVADASGRPDGFHDLGGCRDSYEYDRDGNLIADRNRGLTISYTHRDLVECITAPTGETVRYGSDVVGNRRFRELVGVDGRTALRLDYIDGHVLQDGISRIIGHAEGRLVKPADGREWIYEYHLRDPQGNVRVAFQVDRDLAVVLAADYYPFGLTFVGDHGLDADESPVRHRFGGKELQDLTDLGWYDFGERMLDPSIGRWTAVDPHADRYPHVSPYIFALDNPVRYVDLDGRDAKSLTKVRGLSPTRLNAIDPQALRWAKIEGFELPPEEAFPLDWSTNAPIGARVAYGIVYGLKQRWTSLRDLVLDLGRPTPQLTVGTSGLVIEIAPPRRDHTDALLTLVEIGLLWTPSKAKGPVFAEQKLVFHYTYHAENTFKQGLYRSSSVTAEGSLTASQAVDRLGLSRSQPPDKVIPIIDLGDFIPLERGVVPPHKYGLGGGSQLTNPARVPAEQILPARPIEP